MHLSSQELQSLFGAAPEWTTSLAELIAGVWSALLGRDVQATALPVAADDASDSGNIALRVEAPIMDGEHPILWEVDRSLAAALIDAQVGGDEVSPTRTHGVLTEIEQALVLRALETARQGFNAQPQSNDNSKEFQRLEVESATSPEHPNMSDGADGVTALTFQIELLGVAGRFTWWLNHEHQRWLAPPEPEVTRTFTAVLAEFTLPESDLADLAVGDVIATDSDANGPILLKDESGVTYPVTLGRLGDYKAVQLVAPVENTEQ